MSNVMLKFRSYRSVTWRAFAVVTAGCLALSACGGDDDSSTPTTNLTQPPTSQTTSPPLTQTPVTQAPTTPAAPKPEYVTEGATAIVANASRVNGAAGRMSDRLAAVGYDMGEPTNSGESYGRIETTEIHYSGGDEVKAVADSLAQALGGGGIKVVDLVKPAPTESGNIPSGVSIIVVMGNDVADKTLDQLQGRETGDTVAPNAAETGDTVAPNAAETGDTTGGSSSESTGEAGTSEAP